MGTMTATSYEKTALPDRTLWIDGDSSYDPKRLTSLILTHDVKYVDYIDSNVKEFNKFARTDEKLKVKEEIRPLNFDWKLPEKYKTLNVEEYLYEKLIQSNRNIPDDEFDDRAKRVVEEMIEFRKRNLINVLKTIIYIVETMTSNNVVWGVGRGSSVSSYVLYLIGLHDVDSYLYQLEFSDFLREDE